jgi:hypothetical protein
MLFYNLKFSSLKKLSIWCLEENKLFSDRFAISRFKKSDYEILFLFGILEFIILITFFNFGTLLPDQSLSKEIRKKLNEIP